MTRLRDRIRRNLVDGTAPEWTFNLAGALTLNDPDSEFLLDRVDGFDMPGVRADIGARLAAHGSVVWARYLRERVITFEGNLFGEDGASRQALMGQLGAVFVPTADPIAITVTLPTSARVVYAHATRLAWTLSRDTARGVQAFVGELVAGDPRIYSTDLADISWQPAGLTAHGFDFDFGFDLDFGDGPAGYLTVVNEGTIDSPPVIRIYGPAGGPKLVNLTAGDTMDFTGLNVNPGDYLEIDYAAQTVTLNGEESRFASLVSGDFLGLVPGPNLLQFVATGTSDATSARIFYRSAWSALA